MFGAEYDEEYEGGYLAEEEVDPEERCGVGEGSDVKDKFGDVAGQDPTERSFGFLPLRAAATLDHLLSREPGLEPCAQGVVDGCKVRSDV